MAKKATEFNFRKERSESTAQESFNNMFATGSNQKQDAIKLLSIDMLQDYLNQPFKPYSKERLQELADDILINGILSPLIVRPLEDSYQVLSGHNRKNAALIAGLDQVPCIIKKVDDSTAALIVVNTNLNQREKLLPSEKAFAYKLRLDAIKRKTGRRKKNDSQLGNHFEPTSSEVLSETVGESKNQVFRYIRLTYLITDFLNMVDEGALSLMAGVNLSYLEQLSQQNLLNFMKSNNIRTVSLKQAELIKNLPDIETKVLNEIFNINKSKAKPVFKVGKKIHQVLENGFAKTEMSESEIAEILSELIEQYWNGIKK